MTRKLELDTVVDIKRRKSRPRKKLTRDDVETVNALIEELDKIKSMEYRMRSDRWSLQIGDEHDSFYRYIFQHGERSHIYERKEGTTTPQKNFSSISVGMFDGELVKTLGKKIVPLVQEMLAAEKQRVKLALLALGVDA